MGVPTTFGSDCIFLFELKKVLILHTCDFELAVLISTELKLAAFMMTYSKIMYLMLESDKEMSCVRSDSLQNYMSHR